jgi:hypothetical protein
MGRRVKLGERFPHVPVELRARVFEHPGEELAVPHGNDTLEWSRRHENAVQRDAKQHDLGRRVRRKRGRSPRARVVASEARRTVVPERLEAAGAQEVLDGSARSLEEFRAVAQQAHAGQDQRRAPVSRSAERVAAPAKEPPLGRDAFARHVQRKVLGSQAAHLGARRAREHRVLQGVDQHRAAVVGGAGAVEDLVEVPRRLPEQFDVERLQGGEVLVRGLLRPNYAVRQPGGEIDGDLQGPALVCDSTVRVHIGGR